MRTVQVTNLERLQHLVVTERHAFVVDEPPEEGDGLGPDPYELLLAALGSCTAMTLRLYADRKGWPLESVRVELSHQRVHACDCADCEEKDDGKLDVIRRHILVRGELDDSQGMRLLKVAERCPLHRTLEGGLTIVSQLDIVTG